jgi:hypothetical protein
MKKFFGTLLIFVSILVLVSGCGGSDGSGYYGRSESYEHYGSPTYYPQYQPYRSAYGGQTILPYVTETWGVNGGWSSGGYGSHMRHEESRRDNSVPVRVPPMRSGYSAASTANATVSSPRPKSQQQPSRSSSDQQHHH